MTATPTVRASRTTARGRPVEGPRLVVGVDGSPSSERALAWAVHEAVLRGARVEIIYAGDFGPTVGDRPGAAVPQEWPEHVGSLVRSSLAQIPEVDLVAELTQVASTEVAARALVEASRGAELLVVGSHGGPYPDHAAGGAVTTHCIRYAHCPVVVVRGDPASTSEDDPDNRAAERGRTLLSPSPAEGGTPRREAPGMGPPPVGAGLAVAPAVT